MSDEPKCKTCGGSGFIMVDNESGECCPDCPMEPVKTELEKALEYTGQFKTTKKLTEIYSIDGYTFGDVSFSLEWTYKGLSATDLCKWMNTRQEQVKQLKAVNEQQAEQITALEALVEEIEFLVSDPVAFDTIRQFANHIDNMINDLKKG